MDLIEFFASSSLIGLIVIVIASFFSTLKDKTKARIQEQEQEHLLKNLQREYSQRRARQEKTLAEIAMYPPGIDTDDATWLFLDTTVSGDVLVELAWMTTDVSGRLVDDWHGLPQANDLEKLTEIASKVRGIVIYGMAIQRAAIAGEMRKVGRDDLAAAWLSCNFIDISNGQKGLANLLGKLYLEDEDAPVRGLDHAEARALIIFRCFVKLKEKGEI